MHHAGFTVTFVPRTDQDGHVDGDSGRGGIWKEEEADAVRELVFGNSFEASHLLVGCAACLVGSALGHRYRRLRVPQTENEQQNPQGVTFPKAVHSLISTRPIMRRA